MSEISIRIGGVPEHFNLPIHLANERGDFKKNGISIKWTDFHGGTGQMTKALRNDDVDLCLLLTEGIITDIIRGNPSKIVSDYVITPLTWGIHTGIDNQLQRGDNIFNKKHAISRLGSGSHLMPIVNANSKGQAIGEQQFTVINNLDGALISLSNLETDVFYWEKYTTKPYVDSGQIRRIGEYLTPWPCFVISASDKILQEHPRAIDKMLDIIHESSQQFMQDDTMIPLTSERYQQKQEDIERWYHSTEWAADSWVSDKMMKSVIFHLHAANIIDKGQPIPELIWKR